MQIQVNMSNVVGVRDELIQGIEAEFESTLARFSERITRLEVHIGDENTAGPGNPDKRCLLEARPAGDRPVAVSHHAATVGDACSGAARKLVALLDSRHGRSDHSKGGDSIRRLDVHEGRV